MILLDGGSYGVLWGGWQRKIVAEEKSMDSRTFIGFLKYIPVGVHFKILGEYLNPRQSKFPHESYCKMYDGPSLVSLRMFLVAFFVAWNQALRC